jgi:hypothetical protein
MKLKSHNLIGFKIVSLDPSDIIPEGSIFLTSYSRNDGAIINSRTYTYYKFMIPLRHFKLRIYQKNKIKKQELVYAPLLTI